MMPDPFLEGLRPDATASTRWGASLIQMAAFVHPVLPPDPSVSSVRAVLVREDAIAVMHNRDGAHPVPGGRREPGETLLDTLRREIMEEAGCVIDEPILLGFIHHRHLTPRPENYPYPYPDFCHVVYAARVRDVRTAVDPDGWEERVEFVSWEEAARRAFEPVYRVFVDAARSALSQSP